MTSKMIGDDLLDPVLFAYRQCAYSTVMFNRYVVLYILECRPLNKKSTNATPFQLMNGSYDIFIFVYNL